MSGGTQPAPSGSEPSPGGMESFSSPEPSSFGEPSASEPPPAGEAEPAAVTPESRINRLNILVENSVLDGSHFIRMDTGQESLKEIEEELNKLLGD
jgi:hypothetical protein